MRAAVGKFARRLVVVKFVVAGVIIVQTLDVVLARSARAAVANYAGLVPIVRSSNDKRYSGGITHRGSKHLRAMLAEAAWMAMPRVPVYRAMFERIAQKKNKLVAITAVARRMLEDSFTMLKRDEAFRYVPVTAASAEGTRDSHVDRPCASRMVIEGSKVASSVAG